MNELSNSKVKLAVSIALLAMAVGCGTSGVPIAGTSGAEPAQPVPQACTIPITGVMRDTLTGKPIAGGLAVLETGTPQVVAGFVTRVVNFTEITWTMSDAGGAFRLCTPGPVSTPAVVVLLALDARGNEYPPFVVGAADTLDLQAIGLGECFFVCDPTLGMMPNLAPAVLEGAVTTAPGARAGLVMAQTGIPPLDGSQTVWSITIPGLGVGETNAFQTAPQTGPGACTGLCAPYRFTVPAREPIVQTGKQATFTGPTSGLPPSPGSGLETQERGETLYGIYATAPGCKFPFSAAVPVASDGHSFVPVTPGAVIKVQDAPFMECN